MPMCAVYGCNNSKDHTLFPKSKTLLALWVEKINRQDDVVTRDSRVCSKHFDDNAFIHLRKRIKTPKEEIKR